MRRSLVGLAAAFALAAILAEPAAADSTCWLPAGLTQASLSATIPPAPAPPPAGWSDVLAYVPRYPGSHLAFYATNLEGQEPAVEALYDVGADSPSDVARWYWDHLPEQGWMLAEDGADYRKWTRGEGRLTVYASYEASERTWLRLVRDPDGARSRSTTSLEGSIPLPAGATRWRYDRGDVLPEEWRLDTAPTATLDDVASLLAAEGWLESGSAEVGGALIRSFDRARESVTVAVWAAGDGTTELAVGKTGCLPEDDQPGPGAWRELSVYLDAVPAPPASRLVGFEHLATESRAIETWLGSCIDMDLFSAALGERLDDAGWSGPPGASSRAPGLWERTAVPPDEGVGVFYAAQTRDGGTLGVEVSRQERGRSAPDGASLLFQDLPLPLGASAELLRTETPDAWQFLERYALDSGADLEAFYLDAMPGAGWVHERGDSLAPDPWHVYYAGGEEVRVDLRADAGGEVQLARRRICASGDPVLPDDVGMPSRHLLELPVYPGAVDVGYADGVENYYVSCSGLDLISGWYRTVLESGDWALAGTVGPEDPFHREMLFVRPDERVLPPEDRTAWAEVVIDRDWPYQYTLVLRRDPGGVKPEQPAP